MQSMKKHSLMPNSKFTGFNYSLIFGQIENVIFRRKIPFLITIANGWKIDYRLLASALILFYSGPCHEECISLLLFCQDFVVVLARSP